MKSLMLLAVLAGSPAFAMTGENELSFLKEIPNDPKVVNASTTFQPADADPEEQAKRMEKRVRYLEVQGDLNRKQQLQQQYESIGDYHK